MAFKNSTNNGFGGTAAGNTVTLVVPTGAVAGDLMVAVVSTDDNNPSNPFTPPTLETWTLQSSGSMPIDGTAAASPVAVWIYTKVCSAADQSGAGSRSYDWVPTQTSEEQVGICLLYGPATWGQFAKNEVSGTTTTRDAPSVTTTTANEIVCHCALKDAGVTFSGLPSGTSRLNNVWGATSAAGGGLAIVEETYVSPGATGVKTFTLASAAANGFTFSLEPAIVGPTITSVGGDNDVDDAEASVVVVGTSFGATDTGSAKVEIGDSSIYASANKITQPRSSWSATSITISAMDLGAQSPGMKWMWVTDSTGTRGGAFQFFLHRACGFKMSASADIPASGANTTARLAPPSGKTTGDFDAGRIQDDENPADAVDITSDNYTEMVWSVEACTSARNVEYSFRVTKAGVLMGTYTVTPKCTVFTPSGTRRVTIIS